MACCGCKLKKKMLDFLLWEGDLVRPIFEIQPSKSGLKTRQMPKSAFGVDSLPQEGVSLSLHLLG